MAKQYEGECNSLGSSLEVSSKTFQIRREILFVLCFPFLWTKILAPAIPAFFCSIRVFCIAFPADLHVKEMILCDFSLNGICDWH